MIPWELIDSVPVPGDGVDGETLRLYQRGEEYSIKLDRWELMNSRLHSSEDALAELACQKIATRPKPRGLIGGLGLGFTLATALRHIGPKGQVVVAELVPAVIKWNQIHLGHLADHPLRDRRTVVKEGDVGQIMRDEPGGYDAIMLDVDNAPDGLTRKSNNWLYSYEGLRVTHQALRPRGVLSIWSSGSNRAFSQRLQDVGFKVEEVTIRARGPKGGARHLIWLAERGK